MIAFALVLLAVADTPSAKLDFRLALGEEWDTNARRVVTGNLAILEGASLPSGPVVGDGLTRFLADTEASFILTPHHQAQIAYVLGAKRFYTYGSEDQLIHDLSVGTQHSFADWFWLSTWGTFRASRIRSGTRDYSLGTLGLGLNARPIDLVTIAVSGGVVGFDFKPEERLSYAGPFVGGEVSLHPTARLNFAARVDQYWRTYSGNALVRGTIDNPDGSQTEVVTFCDGKDTPSILPPSCTQMTRNDTELAFALRGAYRGWIQVGGEYLLRVQRSNSDLEDLDRHRLSAFATFPLPLELTGNILAALQINNGISLTQTKFLAEDDENQNSVQAQLGRDLTESLTAQLRYALFANQFSTAPISFLRQTVYLGISYRFAP